MSLSSKARKNRRLRQMNSLSSSSPHIIYSPSGIDSLNASYETSLSTGSNKTASNNNLNFEGSLSAAKCGFLSFDIASSPIGKIFIEDERGFRAIDINQLLQLHNLQQSIPHNTEQAIGLAYTTSKLFHNFSSFCHGTLGGMCLLEALLLMHLIYYPSDPVETLKHFQFLAQPIHNIFNILCIICCISAFDRFDIGNIKQLLHVIKQYKLKVLSILIYPACLLFSLSTINVDEGFFQPEQNSTYWNSFVSEDAENELLYWKVLNISKCIGAVLGWIIVSVDIKRNLFIQSIRNILLTTAS